MGQLPHAFLFSGESQLGKRAVAMELASVLLCGKKNFKGVPCHQCRSCLDVERASYPDCMIVEPQEGKEISIARIRELERFLGLRPFAGSWKIGIVDEAHVMGRDAQHAFLKTLEEPRGNALIILVSSRPFLLLSTIRSRLQQIKFYPVPSDELQRGLEEAGAVSKLASEVVHVSWGRPGKALSLIRSPQALSNARLEESQILSLPRASMQKRFAYAEKIAKDRAGVCASLEKWACAFRSAWIQKGCPAGFLAFLKNIQSTDFLLTHTNTNAKLALEVLLMDIPQTAITRV